HSSLTSRSTVSTSPSYPLEPRASATNERAARMLARRGGTPGFGRCPKGTAPGGPPSGTPRGGSPWEYSTARDWRAHAVGMAGTVPTSVTLPDASSAVPSDGRRARRHRSRDLVVDAMLDLLNEGVLRPTAQQVAER